LSKITKCKSAHTVEKYISYLEESFIFFTIPCFSFKTKEQISANKKIYCIDNGFIHAKATTFSPNMGMLCENLVAITLKKHEINGTIHLYYWKNQQKEEVDFVLQQGTCIKELIQVCYNINNPKTKEREIRALLKASKDLKCNNLILITNEYEKEETTTWFGIKRKIKYIPLWKWLLERK